MRVLRGHELRKEKPVLRLSFGAADACPPDAMIIVTRQSAATTDRAGFKKLAISNSFVSVSAIVRLSTQAAYRARQCAAHQTFDERLARLLVVASKGLFSRRSYPVRPIRRVEGANTRRPTPPVAPVTTAVPFGSDIRSLLPADLMITSVIID